MSTADATTPPTGESLTVFRRWMIMAAITSSTTLYAMTILIVSVVLPQMQGSLSATPDQISWVMTFNILATAVVTPMSGWLAGRFGWRRVMLVSQAGFCIATFLCGIADSLESLVLYRIMQGAFGAPTIPLAQPLACFVGLISPRRSGAGLPFSGETRLWPPWASPANRRCRWGVPASKYSSLLRTHTCCLTRSFRL